MFSIVLWVYFVDLCISLLRFDLLLGKPLEHYRNGLISKLYTAAFGSRQQAQMRPNATNRSPCIIWADWVKQLLKISSWIGWHGQAIILHHPSMHLTQHEKHFCKAISDWQATTSAHWLHRIPKCTGTWNKVARRCISLHTSGTFPKVQSCQRKTKANAIPFVGDQVDQMKCLSRPHEELQLRS